MLYLLHDSYKRAVNPFVNWLKYGLDALENYEKVCRPNLLTNLMQAEYALLHDLLRDYPKPSYGFDTIKKDGQEFKVTQEVVLEKTFCELRLFKTDEAVQKPAMLIVAPLSGHYATLLKDTVKAACHDFDVYVTDWLNCRDIELSKGDFGFDDYVQYVMDFGTHVKEQHGHVHILAVCQPTVPVLCAAALLAKRGSTMQANSIVLMGGPVDARVSPTKVNDYALKHDLQWFMNNVVHEVPMSYKGAMRRVYPGFLQHFGFVAMNMKRHTEAHLDFFNHLLIGADMDARKHQDFYNEYNAVMDLPAKYYVETLANVFLDAKLAKGTIVVLGETLNLNEIISPRLLMIEGELDDISGAGQTHATYDLCCNVAPERKKKLTIEKVGHYGIFAGKTWRNVIYPQVRDFILEK